MAARKNRPVLYEVAGRAARLSSLGRSRNPRESRDEEPVRRAKPAPPPSPAALEPKPEPTPRPETVTPPKQTPPTVAAPRKTPFVPAAALTSRLQAMLAKLPGITASGSSGAIIIASVVVVVVVATIAIRNWSPSDIGANAGAAATPPATVSDSFTGDDPGVQLAGDVSNGDDAGSGAAPPRTNAPTVQLQPGLHYVIAQYFPKSKRRAAEDAALYLRQNGIACALLAGADIRLLATEPFHVKQDDSRAAAAERRKGDALVKRIKDLGKAYNRIGGYDFSGAQLRELR